MVNFQDKITIIMQKKGGEGGEKEESIDSQPSDGRQTFDRNGEGRRRKKE